MCVPFKWRLNLVFLVVVNAAVSLFVEVSGVARFDYHVFLSIVICKKVINISSFGLVSFFQKQGNKNSVHIVY